MIRIFVTISFFLGSILTSLSQYSDLQFSKITTEIGLSSSWIRCIYQDKFGFMWFGTSDGLNRYDGNEIIVYRPNEKFRGGIINGAVNYIREREDGKIWICTEQGVNILDRKRNIFESFPFLDKVRVSHVMTDRSKNHWFSSNSGIYRYNEADSTLRIFRNDPKDPNSLSSNLVECIFQDASNNIWIATDAGLNLYDPILNVFKKYTIAEGNRNGNNQHVLTIAEDKFNRLWIGLINRGLFLFENAADRPDQAKFIHVLDGSVNHLMIDHQNYMWIGCSLGLGLEIIDLNSYSPKKALHIYKYQSYPLDLSSLSDNTISVTFEDHDNTIWLGTFAGGVNYCTPKTKKFHTVSYEADKLNSISNNVVNCFLEDNNYLWIGTERGLCCLDQRTNRYTRYYYQENISNSIGANGVINIYKDSRGNIWIGTWNGGLNLYNKAQNNFKRFLQDNFKKGTICSNHVFAILEDRRGNLWVGTDGGGLSQYHYENNEFTCYLPDESNPESIFHNAVNDLCETSDGKIYLSVYHSLELFDPVKKTFQHFIHNKLDTTSISAGNIQDIFEDSKKNLWIATSSGLNYFNQEKGNFIKYTKSEGLPSNTIQAILEDNEGNLWLSTTNGLSKFIDAVQLPEKPQFINYQAVDGLQGNEFVRRSALKSTSGELYFGGSKGYTYFYPDSITENPVIPNIVFTDFKISDKKELTNLPLRTRKDINLIDQVTLTYYQSDFTIKFAAISYLNPAKNQYKYILEGYETDWHEVGNQHEGTYTNIDPGKYIFKVLGSNNDGIWSKSPKTLIINITPPWWGTILAWIIYSVLGAILLYSLFKIRFRILEKQKSMLEQKVKERTLELSEMNSLLEEKQEEITMQNEELSDHRNHLEKLVVERTAAMELAIQRAESSDKLKSAFLANMSHEIRTPMNAIVGFASLLRGEEINNEERREFIDIIFNNCEILMVLINDILEISLIEANQLQLKMVPFYPDLVLEELASFFQMNKSQNISLALKKPELENKLVLCTDQTRFRQVITNLLNNAFKYTEKGHIWFGYEIIENKVQFFVEDTGIGIDEAEYQNIFNYFHKIDKGDNKLYRGAGIGLSISNKLVELMGGKIWLSSKVGIGTTFYFTLPSAINETYTITPRESAEDIPIYNLSEHLILVAEDEANNYVLIEKILRATNAQIVWAKNGREAIEYVKKYGSLKDIIIIMDIKMPIMNGIHAANEIGKIDSKIPIIAVTAYAQLENKEEILRHNFCDYLAKPLQPSILLKKIYQHAGFYLSPDADTLK
jgi:signal transduction histidine kinase/ligand-binding sensor domain-containing protein/ActR/RegA family two-component response regulator